MTAAALREPDILPHSRAEHDRMANAIRALAMDAVEQAKSGHPGLPIRGCEHPTDVVPDGQPRFTGWWGVAGFELGGLLSNRVRRDSVP